MIPAQQMQKNPLTKFFRQPKIYMRLPSNGENYPKGSLEMTESGELPVYAMTAKDELSMKTPDALINGQATVDVIQSCMPNIKNAWKIPSIDIDAILVAIRIATYGEKLTITTKVPNVGEERDFEVDLRMLAGEILQHTWESACPITDEITAILRPLNYKEFTENALKTFEEQKILNLVNDQSISDEKKLEEFNKSFKRLSELTIGMASTSIVQVVTPDGSVDNPAFIKEFIENADKEFFTKITNHLEEQRSKFNLKPLNIISTEEDKAAGAPETWEVPITFDQSNFFA
jgi:hypothetical protein